ncbi:MAG: autotransporter domain-containing protein [Puniceicoccales bacterium]|jgi:hypothetical protein|nr:autotransporter domain-containing protein [Puniceicoccales bacterium]
MKEEGRKMGLLANRYGLLTVLGLGCSFLGTAAHGAETPVTDNTRYVAGKNAGNVFQFEADGSLPAAAAGGAAIFHAGAGDRLILNEGKLAQVVFDNVNAPGAPGFAPTVGNDDLAAAKTLLANGGDLNNIFVDAGNPALATLLNKIAVIQAVNAITTLDPTGVAANNLHGGLATAGLGNAVDAPMVQRIFDDLKADMGPFVDKADLDTYIGNITGAGGQNINGHDYSADIVITQVQLGAIGTEIARIAAAIFVPGHAVTEATAQATEATTFSGKLNTGMGNGAWNDAAAGTAILVDGTGTNVDTGNLGAAGIAEEIATQCTDFIEWLEKATNVTDDDLIAAVDAVFGGAPATRAAAIAAIVAGLDLETKLNDAKTAVYGALKGLFDVAPAAAAGTPRTFAYQISQDNLANDLNFANNHLTASGNFAVIDPGHMSADETVLFVFDNGSTGAARDVRAGKILYKNLDKNLNLHLRHTMTNNGATLGIVTLEEIKDPLNPDATQEHLTLQLSSNGEERADNTFDFVFNDEIKVKKLILGINSNQTANIVEGNKLISKALKAGGVDVKFEFDLIVAEDIEVLQNSELVIANTKTLFLGRDLKLRDGNAKLYLGTSGGHGGTVNIEPLLAQVGNIVFKDGDVLVLTSNVTLNVTNPNAGQYFFKGLKGTPGAKFTITSNDPAIALTLEGIDNAATHVNGLDITATGNNPAMITVENGGTLTISSITIATTDDVKSPIIAKFGNNGTLALASDVTLGQSGVDITAVKAGNDFTIVPKGNATLYGSVNAGTGIKLVVDLSNSGTLTWPEGNLTLPNGEKLKIEIGASDAIVENGLSELKTIVDRLGNLDVINIAGNTNVATLGALLSLDIASPLLKGATLTFDAATNRLVLTIPANAFPSNFSEYLANGGSFDRSYVSNGLFSILDKAAQNGAKTNIERRLLKAILDTNISNAQKSKSLSALSKTTTEEKNRATLALIDSARETIYGKMGQDPAANKHYSAWVSGFGDVARSGSSGSYKMNCDIYGFTLGVDTHINDNFLLGAAFGYGKAKAKFKGDMAFGNDRCDIKSYFGGIYGLWDELVTDLSIKFSALAGHGKYEENRNFFFGNGNVDSTYDSNHDGNWLSGNVDCTYKHWNVYGFNIGPWVSLSATTIHQKSGDIGSATTTGTGRTVNESATHYKREVAAADRRSIEATLGIAADYEFAAGNLELALGYKHDWRKLKGGKVSIWEAFSDGNYKGLTAASNDNHISEFFKFDASHMKTGKHAFVARAAWNMQFGDFGLTLGGHGQAGSHFKDIAGFITASYSF